MKYQTLILHNGNEIDKATGALNIPIYQASTFNQEDVEIHQKYTYARSENPTREALEKTVASLESGKHGYAFSSGMAAISSAISAFIEQGDHIIATSDIYGGSYRILTQFFNKFGVTTTLVDTTDLNNIKDAIKPNTKLLFLETPSNPLLKVTDIVGCVEIAKKHNLITILDNTFMSPYFQRPIELGIDVVVHSATKFIGGHSDVIGGVTVVKNDEYAKKIYFVQNGFGAILSPQDSFLLLRGIKTLKVRMEESQNSAIKIANHLKTLDWIEEVYYPGLNSHKGHNILKTQASGFGGVLSFKTKNVEQVKRIMKNVKLWAVAVSLGGVESILSYPARMSHYAIPKDQREKMGVTDNLLRLSVGLEDPDDLINDLEDAIK
ncbi:MAG: cystathionine gamma-synthase [Spirochaetes bacterium GWC1_27_15]|nr:MAG: cystathionine gamma-synthase [Spirochaetes bacterium GWB1_27_13]OHD27555.1 MAG: cystathionine gamma-synthase [Spirochaetes bacterium GWC1_27_15]